MTNGKGSAYSAEARLREACKSWAKTCRNNPSVFASWVENGGLEKAITEVLAAPVKEALTAPQAEVESGDFHKLAVGWLEDRIGGKHYGTRDVLTLVRLLESVAARPARTNGVACPSQMNQLNGQWELVSTAGTGGVALTAIIEKLREDADQMESPYWTKTPDEPNWSYVAKAFREIANDLARGGPDEKL